MENINELVEKVRRKNVKEACGATYILAEESAKSGDVYLYMDEFIKMIEDKNSYIRNRGFALISANAKWDKDKKIDGIIDVYLKHIVDEKPITARQCIKSLPIIAKYKPKLVKNIKEELSIADISKYADSIKPLIAREIETILRKLS